MTRSLLIDITVRLLNLVSKIHYKNHDVPIGWRDHLRWWLDGKLSTVFGWAWSGSDEELEAVLSEEIPLEYMSPRQRAYYDRLNATRLETRQTPEAK
jgi:hypothetical protein